MSEVGSAAWRGFSQDFARFESALNSVRAINLNSYGLRQEAADLAQRYLSSIRPHLAEARLQDETETLDGAFATILQLSEGHNLVSSYKKQTKRIRKVSSSVTAKLALHAGETKKPEGQTEEERKLIKTLHDLVPSAALSYAQAISDLQDDKRHSFRGPALELREALREALDALAPDKDVQKAPWYKPEDGRSHPTTKQKVRFILSARGVSKSGLQTPQDTAITIDELIGELTRSVQNLSSIAIHVATERANVRRIKRYIDAVLHDILLIS